LARPGMAGDADHHVAGLVSRAAAPPVAVGLGAISTGSGLTDNYLALTNGTGAKAPHDRQPPARAADAPGPGG